MVSSVNTLRDVTAGQDARKRSAEAAEGRVSLAAFFIARVQGAEG